MNNFFTSRYYSASAIVFTIITIVVVSRANCHEIDDSITNLVGDVSATLFFPSAAISALLCAKTDTTFNFFKKLSENRILANQLEFDEFDRDMRYPHEKTAFLLDLDCPRALETLKKANTLKMLSAPLKWMILQDLTNNSKDCSSMSDHCLPEDFKRFEMYPDSEVVILQRTARDSFEILSVYRPSPVRDMVVEERGYWSDEDGLKMRDFHVSSWRRRDLRRTPLKSSIVITNPDTINHLDDYKDKHIDTVTKCNYIWLRHLVDSMNSTLTYTVVNSWGYRDENGSWNGLMGLLSSREIDIGGTSMFLVADRWEYATYIPLSYPSKIAFVFREPPLSFVSNLFMLPFSSRVWIAVGVLLLIILALLFVALKWEWIGRDTTESPAAVPTLSDNLLLIIGAAAQQGFGLNPRTVPSRIVILMLLLAVLNLYASYSANIVALLQSTTTSIKTLRDLYESPIKCGAQDIVYMRHYFKMEKDPLRRSMIDRKIDPKDGRSNIVLAEEGVKRVRAGFYAFFMETGPAYKLIQETFEEDEKCGFREIPFIEHADPTFVIPKNSPYTEIMRVSALKIEESGLKSREMSRLYTKRPPCNGRSKFISVGINECYFAFYTMGYGMLLAFVVFVFEVLWMKSSAVRIRVSEKDPEYPVTE